MFPVGYDMVQIFRPRPRRFAWTLTLDSHLCDPWATPAVQFAEHLSRSLTWSTVELALAILMMATRGGYVVFVYGRQPVAHR